ncbi:hypothetical protein NBRC110019_02420 [Neptunitalea chrysea]|uniref:Uncharacterized protein n=1 Tax=Neptunitalea chrysea TaxID=1647581 RepID=A0A9W6EV79_9FLAO|nr:hypothetical protein [Neptunitalea chrysea]GLB51203.1 hypothetical protein NBRC110019_02420 [Neptunitalea chrysea]
MFKKKLANFFLALLCLHAVFYCVLYFLDIYGFSRVIAVFSIPLLIVYYVLKSVKIDYFFIVSLTFVFIGDVINSFYPVVYNMYIVLYALNLAYYSYYILRELGDKMTVKNVLLPAIPYTGLYIVTFYYLSAYLRGVSVELILIYNFFMGVFVVSTWIKFMVSKGKGKIYSLVSSTAIILMSILFMFNEFIYFNKIVNDFIINFLFLGAHLFMTLYVVDKENAKYNPK